MTTPDERAVIRKHSRSFALAARLLSQTVRKRAELLYAWCRHADDAIDLATTPLAAVVALNELRTEVESVYGGRPTRTPAGRMLAEVVADVRLPREYPDELLRGMEMDAAGTRYRTLDELLVYCHRVAGVVGLMMCHAMGVADDRATEHAAHLGVAMQLTNIARDVAEDWDRGRLYLPLDWLGGEPPAGQPLKDDLVAPAVARLLAEADRYYAFGDDGLPHLDRRCRLAVRVAREVYSRIGAEVRRRECRPSAGRAVTSTTTKLRVVASAAWQTWPERDPASPLHPPSAVYSFRPLPTESAVPFTSSGATMNNGWRNSMYNVTFGLALVLLTATVLFLLVGINPKNAEYSFLPWLYSGLSAVGGVVFWLISGRLGRTQSDG
jgi:phytoene synthase